MISYQSNPTFGNVYMINRGFFIEKQQQQDEEDSFLQKSSLTFTYRIQGEIVA